MVVEESKDSYNLGGREKQNCPGQDKRPFCAKTGVRRRMSCDSGERKGDLILC